MNEKNPTKQSRLRQYLSVFQYSRQAVKLVWQTSPALTVTIGIFTVLGGILPPATAWVGKEMIDAVLFAIDNAETGSRTVLFWILIEASLIASITAARKGLSICETLLRAQLSNKVNLLILEKALQLDLTHFEDSEVYDKMTRARRQASSRPLSLVQRVFRIIQNCIALVSYGILLIQFSGLTVIILVLGALPAFVAENKFAEKGFQLFRWQSPAKREQMYLETVVAREDYAKEVILLGIGPKLVQRYGDIFTELYGEDKKLVIRRGIWGYALGLLSTLTLYGAYIWIALAAIDTKITLGEMTMYLMVFKQGQNAFTSLLQNIGGMYEDNLYLSNLYEFLDIEVLSKSGNETKGPNPEQGIVIEDVTFTYPGSETPAIQNINLHIKPGQKMAIVGHNGSGKTTLIKLLSGLYVPQKGEIRLDGLSINKWNVQALRRRIGVIFQDFSRYQFTVGENIGVGDVEHMNNEQRWEKAAQKGMANTFVEQFDQAFQTPLGRWFGGRELSLGQWQKIALSRAFMSESADILILDEPTAAMDAEAEAKIFERFQEMTSTQMAILISHRFSTVRMADSIIVLDKGKIVETGNHSELMQNNGRYAQLFTTQAAGYLH